MCENIINNKKYLNMTKLITTVPFSRVRKLEFPELVNGVIQIVEDYNPVTMHIADQYNLLLEVQPQLSGLVVYNRKLQETEVLGELRLKRKNILKGLVSQTKALVKTGLESQKQNVEIVSPFVMNYWKNLVTLNDYAITETMKQMLLSFDRNTPVKDAFTALGLLEIVDELKVIQAKIASTLKKRIKSNMELPKMNTRQVKRDVGSALADLIDSITLAQKVHTELDYVPMISEINVLLGEYQSKIKSRKTRSMNEKTTDDQVSNTQKLATAV